MTLACRPGRVECAGPCTPPSWTCCQLMLHWVQSSGPCPHWMSAQSSTSSGICTQPSARFKHLYTVKSNICHLHTAPSNIWHMHTFTSHAHSHLQHLTPVQSSAMFATCTQLLATFSNCSDISNISHLHSHWQHMKPAHSHEHHLPVAFAVNNICHLQTALSNIQTTVWHSSTVILTHNIWHLTNSSTTVDTCMQSPPTTDTYP